MDNDESDWEWELLKDENDLFDEILDEIKNTNVCPHCSTPLALEHQSDNNSLQMVEVSECPACGLERRKKFHQLN